VASSERGQPPRRVGAQLVDRVGDDVPAPAAARWLDTQAVLRERANEVVDVASVIVLLTAPTPCARDRR
jgi:hypothetical protein